MATYQKLAMLRTRVHVERALQDACAQLHVDRSADRTGGSLAWATPHFGRLPRRARHGLRLGGGLRRRRALSLEQYFCCMATGRRVNSEHSERPGLSLSVNTFKFTTPRGGVPRTSPPGARRCDVGPLVPVRNNVLVKRYSACTWASSRDDRGAFKHVRASLESAM